MINADRIRQMTNEELAEWFAKNAECPPTKLWCQEFSCDAENCWLYFLEQEVEG